jgi:hypothetical protein
LPASDRRLRIGQQDQDPRELVVAHFADLRQMGEISLSRLSIRIVGCHQDSNSNEEERA